MLYMLLFLFFSVRACFASSFSLLPLLPYVSIHTHYKRLRWSCFRMNSGVRLAHYYWWYVCKDLCSFSLRISLFPIYTFDHVHCDYQQLKNVGYSSAFFQSTPHVYNFQYVIKVSLSLSSINSQITCISSAHFTINPLIWNEWDGSKKKVSSNLLSSLSISNFNFL